MLRKELIKEVANTSGHTEKIVREVFEATVTQVLQTLAHGHSVMLLGLGKISVVRRGEKKARNIHDGSVVMVPPRNVPVLRPSDALHIAVNA